LTEKSGRTFTARESVATDGVRFVECRFEGAILVYSGGQPPVFERCSFANASWEFAGAALRTIQLLQAINAAPGGKSFVDDLFAPGAYITG
jgi:hypothetical protein